VCSGIGIRQHRGVECWHTKKNGRALLGDGAKRSLWGDAPRKVDGTGTYGQWEIEPIAQAVGKVELGCGEGDIVRCQAQHGLGVKLSADMHSVLEMDAAFGKPGAARAIEPKRRVVASGQRSGQLGAGPSANGLEV